MIRDPSDGTVRETQHRAEPLKTKDKSAGMPVLSTTASGLATDKLKADELARLERARDWLKAYFHRKTEP